MVTVLVVVVRLEPGVPGHAGDRGDRLELVDHAPRQEVDVIVAKGDPRVAETLHAKQI